MTGRADATKRLRRAAWSGARARLERWFVLRVGLWGLPLVALACAHYLAAVTGNQISARAAKHLADERLAVTSQ